MWLCVYPLCKVVAHVADLVRKYSDASSDIVSHLASNVDIVTSPEGRAAIVWMLGEFGHVSVFYMRRYTRTHRHTLFYRTYIFAGIGGSSVLARVYDS